MFLAKSAARLCSFTAHTMGLAALAAVPAPTLLPPIDPPCADVMTWMPVRAWAFPSPAGASDRSSELPIESAPSTVLDEFALTVDEPPTLGIAGGVEAGVEGGICGCGVIGGIVPGSTQPIMSLPQTSPALAATLLPAGDDVPVPAKLVDVQPRYPSLAKQLRLDGVVVLDATIDEAGSVVDVRVLRSMTAFDRAATEAVRQWRYAPAMRNGLPVRILLTVTVSFTHPV